MNSHVALTTTSLVLLLSFPASLGAEIHFAQASETTTASITAQAVLERLLKTPKTQADWFAPSFLKQVSLSQVQAILDDIRRQLGQYQSVVEDGDNYFSNFEKGTVPTQIGLNDKGQITRLFFQPPRLNAISIDEAILKLKKLPGQTSLSVWENGVQAADLNADTPLAVGSTFKLAVLEALQSKIAKKQMSWDSAIRLKPEWKSLPTGILQTWPSKSWLTIESLATLMISQSDNTATDALIELVGKSEIEALALGNIPFLTTREAFSLKSPKNQELKERYLAAGVPERRDILSEPLELPTVAELGDGLISPEIEWFFSTQELCQFMGSVAQLPLMQINPGVALPQDWQQVAYKGGSEPGVLNLTTQLVSREGTQYCISATWNHNQPLDEAQFTALYSSLLTGLKHKTME